MLLAVTWSVQLTDLETGQQTLANGGKSSSLKETEIVAGTDCLETSRFDCWARNLFDCSMHLTLTLLI